MVVNQSNVDEPLIVDNPVIQSDGQWRQGVQGRGTQSRIGTDRKSTQAMSPLAARHVQADPPNKSANRARPTAQEEGMPKRADALDRRLLEAPQFSVQLHERATFRLTHQAK